MTFFDEERTILQFMSSFVQVNSSLSKMFRLFGSSPFVAGNHPNQVGGVVVHSRLEDLARTMGKTKVEEIGKPHIAPIIS